MQFLLRLFFGVAAVVAVFASIEYNEYPKIKQVPNTYELFTAIKIILNAREKLLPPKDYNAEVSQLREIQFLLAHYVRKYVEERVENFVKVSTFIKNLSLNENDKELVNNIWQRLDFALLNYTSNEAFRNLELAIKKILEGIKGGNINWN